MHRLLTTISCIAVASAAAAEPVRLKTAALKSTFTGALVEMDTPAGTVIPVRFNGNGLVSGEAGVLGPVLGAARDRGRWWVADDELCMKWFRWFEAKQRCVRLSLDGARIFWSGEEGRTGTGRIVEPAPVIASATPEPAQAAPKPPVPAARPDAAPTEEDIAAKSATAEAVAAAAAVAEAEVVEVAVAEQKPAADIVAAMADVEVPAHTPVAAGMAGGGPTIRFASAAIASLGLMSPLAKERNHLLDDEGRRAIANEPNLATIKGHADPIPQHTVAAAGLSVPPAAQAPAASKPARSSAPTQASSATIRASYRVAGVAYDDTLNVRSGPALYYDAIGELPPDGRDVSITGPCRSDWCPIRHGRTSGWVNRNFLAEDTTAPTATALTR